jgi:hypothetical protein
VVLDEDLCEGLVCEHRMHLSVGAPDHIAWSGAGFAGKGRGAGRYAPRRGHGRISLRLLSATAIIGTPFVGSWSTRATP